MSIYANATHGIVCAVEEGPENYFGWPSVARLDDGTLVAGSSGLRSAHVDPWGKSVIHYSTDSGRTWGAPVIAHNDQIDNRDLGIVALGGQKFAITWFSLDTRIFTTRDMINQLGKNDRCKESLRYMADWDNDTVSALVGSWLKITGDGGKTWTRPIHVPVSAPHGFSVLADGSFGYLGKRFWEHLVRPFGPVQYCASTDGGYTWEVRGTVPIPEAEIGNYHEPHVIQRQDGTLLGVIRKHLRDGGMDMDVSVTYSRDGGWTWTEPEDLGVWGSPPHLLRHSSGALVMVYGYRHPGYGQRAIVSYDDGDTWSDEIILRDDGNDGDLGYPASVELEDGSIYTVYYQALPGRKNTSLLWTRWELPER